MTVNEQLLYGDARCLRGKFLIIGIMARRITRLRRFVMELLSCEIYMARLIQEELLSIFQDFIDVRKIQIRNREGPLYEFRWLS